MTGRLIAIGDVHGCRDALVSLLQWIAPTAEDTVVMLGDYVDRGPESKGVVEVLLETADSTRLIGLMGNHEEMMLDVLDGHESHHNWLRFGGMETLESYDFAGDMNFLPPDHDAFYRNLGDFYETGDYFFTHAAYDPTLELEAQPPEMLRWHSLRQGVPGPHPSGRIAVVGHTANHDGAIYDAGHLICLDTFCYGGGWLTAMEFPSRNVWQVDAEGRRREQADG